MTIPLTEIPRIQDIAQLRQERAQVATALGGARDRYLNLPPSYQAWGASQEIVPLEKRFYAASMRIFDLESGGHSAFPNVPPINNVIHGPLYNRQATQ